MDFYGKKSEKGMILLAILMWQSPTNQNSTNHYWLKKNKNLCLTKPINNSGFGVLNWKLVYIYIVAKSFNLAFFKTTN